MKCLRILSFAILCALFALMPQHAPLAKTVKPAKHAPKVQAPSYHRAFELLDAGQVEQAYLLSQKLPDPVLNMVIRSVYMAQPNNMIGFEEMDRFIAANPDWPNLRGILAIAEQKLPATLAPAQVIAWFRAHPPQTNGAFNRYVDALQADGEGEEIRPLILTRWVNADFSPDDLAAFHARYNAYLGIDLNWARLDRLLWKNDAANARYAMNYVGEDMKAVAEARLALANQSINTDYYIGRVSPEWQRSPGMLYERLRWLVRSNRDDEAVDLLLHAPADLGKPEAWWEQRQIMVYRLIQKHNYAAAYQMAAEHGQTDGKQVAQAEFLAGWLALRFLNETDNARQHFQILYNTGSTPMTRARGAYWLGRAYEALGDKNSAEQAYETAATFNTTFYGQLAATRLSDAPMLALSPEPPVPPAVKQSFYNRNSTRAIQRLHAIAEDDRAKAFFHAMIEAAERRVDFVLLSDLGYSLHRPDLAIEAAKAANQKNIMLGVAGYPLLNHPIPQPPEAAFTHALIRQESMFNPDARSPVGAHGLMQLMRGTAADVARKLDIKFVENKLDNPDYNLKLGTNFVEQQINSFNGSYILALAGYNAGPRRVRDWMAMIGDPRNPDVDPVDWMEEIPITETRNYVERIMESLQVYRARLNNGQAPLLIIKDLRR